jgi:hypothetical protein
MRTATIAVLAALLLSGTAAQAWFEPPITGPRDAACRDEARAKVFTAPDPERVGLFETGKRIYSACMASGTGRSRTVASAGEARQ